MSLTDPEYVHRQYDSTVNLQTRIAVWQPLPLGHSPQDVALSALLEVRPTTVLEVGAGPGTFAKRCKEALRCGVLALDSSAAMVEACQRAGVDAVVGDVTKLPFSNESFDAVVAAWMLYHVADLERALGELARVLAPGGRFVAITNGRDHLARLWALADTEHAEPRFSRENGGEQLSRHFSRVLRHDVATHAHFADRGAAANYLRSLGHDDAAARLPDFEGPLKVGGTPTVFIADK